jgi:hypothetical protein
MRIQRLAMLLFFGGTLGCVAHHVDLGIQVHDEPNRPVRYEGPLAGPYDDLEELVDTACEHMVRSPASLGGRHTRGYCALFFSAPDEQGTDKWFIGNITPLEDVQATGERSCRIPVDLVERRDTEVLSLGGVDSTPPEHESWRPTLFFNQRTRATWERDVLLFSLETPETCTTYGFVGFDRVVTRHRGNGFVPMGTVYNEQGVIQAVQDE